MTDAAPTPQPALPAPPEATETPIKPAKHAGGRPRKVTPHVARKLFLLAGYGLTDLQIGEVLGISIDTVMDVKKQAEYSPTIARCKDSADLKVINALYHRAIGYSHPEEKIFQFEGTPIRVPTIKHYPPDTAACELWLRNRRRDEWRGKDAKDAEAEKPKPTTIRLFTRLHASEVEVVSRGDNQVDVLFGAEFTGKVAEKAKQPEDRK